MAVAKKSAKAPAVPQRNDRIDWRSLYLYAVCLITLLVILFSTVSLINAIMILFTLMCMQSLRTHRHKHY
jgi:4-amino-4-deoxy-L-arabinose transferase-like glycosyltransferase